MPTLRPGRGPQTATRTVTVAARITRQSPRAPAHGAGVVVIDRGRRASLHIDPGAVRAVIEHDGVTFAVMFDAEALARAAFAALTAADLAGADAATRKALRAAADPEGFTPDRDGVDLAGTLVARGLATKGRAVLAQLDAAATPGPVTREALKVAAVRDALRGAAGAAGFAPATPDEAKAARDLTARGLAVPSEERPLYSDTWRTIYRATDKGRAALDQFDAAAPTTSTPEGA